MAQCMAMGQAVGTAAAMMVKEKKTPQEIAVNELQSALRKSGAILETP
jgi:hypothetical protein